jgi:hypothetical protein
MDDDAPYYLADGFRCARTMPATAVPTKTTGAPTEHAYRALSGRPGFGRMLVPGIGGPGLKRNDRVTCLHRWISRYMVYQLHTHAMPLTATAARIAEGLVNIGPCPFLTVAAWRELSLARLHFRGWNRLRLEPIGER